MNAPKDSKDKGPIYMRFRSALTLGAAVATLSACAQINETFGARPDTAPTPTAQPAPNQAPAATTPRPPSQERFPSAQARTADEFDTTTDEERAAATAPAETGGGGGSLGTTVASLGDPSSPGFWLETPLVETETEGRVVYTATGASANVTLRPIPGESGSGSRISLSAMRVLEAPLTDLPTLEVYADG